MIEAGYIDLVLSEVKYGVDQFNRHSTCKASYPDRVEIEFKGVKIIVPFNTVSNDEATHEK
jgi:hypothetical protein